MTTNITAKGTVADIRAALAAAGIEAPAKATKTALLDLLMPATALDTKPTKAKKAPAKKAAAKPVPKRTSAKHGDLTVNIAQKFVRVLDADGRKIARLAVGTDISGEGKVGPSRTSFDGGWIITAHVEAVRAALAAGVLL